MTPSTSTQQLQHPHGHSLPQSSPNSGNSSGGSTRPALNLAGVFGSPRPPQASPTAASSHPPPPPLTYGSMLPSSTTFPHGTRSGDSSGHNTDGEEEDERRQLITLQPYTSSSSPPLRCVEQLASSVPFDGYAASHSVTIDLASPDRSPTPLPMAGVAHSPGAVDAQSSPRFIWIEFSVADNGAGMSPQALQHVFTPYSEAKLKTYRPNGGSQYRARTTGVVLLLPVALRLFSSRCLLVSLVVLCSQLVSVCRFARRW
jgi:hypothetical protein